MEMDSLRKEFRIKSAASLSNCFVIGHDGPSDSYGGIMKIDQEQVQLMKRRGGVGHDLSHIRPTGSPVLNSALTSTVVGKTGRGVTELYNIRGKLSNIKTLTQ